MQKFSIVKKMAAIIPNLLNTESIKKGKDFEKYARNILFPPDHYILIDKTHCYLSIADDIPESVMKPDYTFRDKVTNKEFYLEAKFRTYLYFDQIRWTYPKQLERYQEYNKLLPVFVLLGLGNVAANPSRIFLLSLPNAKYKGLFLSEARKYEISKSEPVNSDLLWKL